MASRKSRRVSRKSRRVSRKSRRVSRKSRRVSRKSRRVSRKSRRVSRKSRKLRKNPMERNERRCKNILKNKISINLKELKKGVFTSKKQAIAVAYSQVKKMRPSCKKYFTKKSA